MTQKPLNPPEMRRSLGQKLVPVADRLRGLLTEFGIRPYTVTLLRTRWSGGRRGIGEEILVEQVPLLPTPKIADLTGVIAITSAAGLLEQGTVLLSKISGRFTEDQLRGNPPDGTPQDPDEQFFYEVHFPRLDGSPGERRRFVIESAPYYNAGALHWSVQLRKANADRQRSGDMRR